MVHVVNRRGGIDGGFELDKGEAPVGGGVGGDVGVGGVVVREIVGAGGAVAGAGGELDRDDFAEGEEGLREEGEGDCLVETAW